jgi:hypothetical protein
MKDELAQPRPLALQSLIIKFEKIEGFAVDTYDEISARRNAGTYTRKLK